MFLLIITIIITDYISKQKQKHHKPEPDPQFTPDVPAFCLASIPGAGADRIPFYEVSSMCAAGENTQDSAYKRLCRIGSRVRKQNKTSNLLSK